MKSYSVLVFLSSVLACTPVVSADSKPPLPSYRVNYEGGNLRLNRQKVTATLHADEIVLTAGRERIAVPARNITALAHGNGVRRRFGAAVLDVVPFTHLGETEIRYIGLSWVEDAGAAGKPRTVEAVFRLSASDYPAFLAALERLAGRKAVDPARVPTVVRYGL